MKIKSFEDLEIYQLSLKLAVDIYRLTNILPSAEKYVIRDQIIRAVNSIGANIAEGFGRDTRKEFIKYLYNSRGSLLEVRHFLNLVVLLKYTKADDIAQINRNCNTLGVKINNLITRLKELPQ